jgi:transcriptional regulator with XRE-family HTH domain
MIEASQIRAARALLNANQTKLSEWASVSVATIKRIESASVIRGAAETLWKIQKALEAAGVEFIPEDEFGGPGVRLRDRTGGNAKKQRGRRSYAVQNGTK